MSPLRAARTVSLTSALGTLLKGFIILPIRASDLSLYSSSILQAVSKRKTAFWRHAMASRRLLPPSVRDTLLGIPFDTASLERNYVLADEDLELIDTRRNAANRLALAIHIALYRHPGQGWLDGTNLPGALLVWLAEQVAVPVSALADYGTRGQNTVLTTDGWPSGILGCVRSYRAMT